LFVERVYKISEKGILWKRKGKKKKNNKTNN